MRKYILIVEDDVAMLKFLRTNLAARGYEVRTAVDGHGALKQAELRVPDLILLDLNLPGINGFEVLGRIRDWCSVPILVISARCDESDKVLCLDNGADDYILKPFGLDELLARVRALLRRTETNHIQMNSSRFKCHELELDFNSMQLQRNGKSIKLTEIEYKTLKLLTINAGKVLTHNMILSDVWGSEYQDNNQYTHVIINRLRKKIEQDISNPVFIQTVPGVGYRFCAN